MYRWAVYTPQITAKLLECYRKKDFSAITWWKEHKRTYRESYQDGLLDLQAFWNQLASFVHDQDHIDIWNQTIMELGIVPNPALTLADFPRLNGIDRHGIPSLRLHQYCSCRRNTDIIPKLWELTDIAQAYAAGGRTPIVQNAFIQTFDKLLQMTAPAEKTKKVKREDGSEEKIKIVTQKQITPAFLSKLLFLSFPYVFVTIDGNTKKSYPNIDVTNGEEYLSMCNNVKSRLLAAKQTDSAMHDVLDDELLIYFSAYAYISNN